MIKSVIDWLTGSALRGSRVLLLVASLPCFLASLVGCSSWSDISSQVTKQNAQFSNREVALKAFDGWTQTTAEGNGFIVWRGHDSQVVDMEFTPARSQGLPPDIVHATWTIVARTERGRFFSVDFVPETGYFTMPHEKSNLDIARRYGGNEELMKRIGISREPA